jgi:aminoglycoside phosphotransferase (APT) family kinase protein
MRAEARDGSGTLEWRSEDHPAAGLIRAPEDPSAVFFYVHHAVRGTTVRADATAHVSSYQLGVGELQRLTIRALQQLQSLDAASAQLLGPG